MKLPERDCYALEELARRWRCDVNEIHHFIAMDLLAPSIFVNEPMQPIYFTVEYSVEDGNEVLHTERLLAEESYLVTGLVSLRGRRTGPMEKRFNLFFTGDSPSVPMFEAYTAETVKDFSSSKLYAVSALKSLGPDGEIPAERLVIATKEVARFEAQYINPIAEPGHVEEKPITTTERNTLLVLIAALCAKAGIDPKARGAAGQLMTLAEVEIGVALDDGTVRNKLAQISDAVGARQR